MRMLKVSVLAATLVALGSPAHAAAAPKNYCADLNGAQVGSTCQIKVSDDLDGLVVRLPESQH